MKVAGPIHLLERDYFLQFNRKLDIWPPEELDLLAVSVDSDAPKPGIWMAGSWQRHVLDTQPGGYLWRELTREPREGDTSYRKKGLLREMMLRFPSAPLFGSQSKTGFQVQMTPFHQHTLRLLRSAQNIGAPVTKLFLIFNGLNELDHFGFYYDLAGLLINNNSHDNANVACLIVPFPAHLTRYPLVGRYAERPLQRFISDPSDLFRQYLRFMVETQWLISTLVPISDYPVASGIPLIASHSAHDMSHCNPSVLGSAVYRMWQAIFDSSQRSGLELSENDVLQSIAVVRHLIGWTSRSKPLGDRGRDDPLDHPQLHVIGYSLGGYLAQSVFFSWPYAIGSCTTLSSGGALNSLRPEKILHEEEWRAITHGLQYDIESGLLEGRIALDDRLNPATICGVPVSIFTSHFQTFMDIFLQDPYGTYRHRVSEFAPRLFFVVGGNDPIVPTRTVLDTSPPDGINMIAIAKLSHFIATDRGEWPEFWLPTVTNIITSLSDHSEHLLQATTENHLWNADASDAASESLLDLKAVKNYTKEFLRTRSADRREPEPLNSEAIQETILQFVKRLEVPENPEDSRGFLLILRNQIPVTLMGSKVLHRRGAVPHYADPDIRRYWAHLQEQRLGMHEAADRVAIVIPGQLNDWFAERIPMLSAKHLPIVAGFQDYQAWQTSIWNDFLNDWEATGGLYRFDAQPATVSGPGFQLEELIRADTAAPSGDFWILNCLPDVWISLSSSAVRYLAGGVDEREGILAGLRTSMLRIYTAHRKKGREPLTPEEKNAQLNLQRLLETDQLQILRISAAQSSPRYLGERIRSFSAGVDVLTHTALALARSIPCHKKDDFAKTWKADRNAITDETGKRIGPFYVNKIGRGAMAEVYEAVVDGRVVAIKTMSSDALRDDDNRKRFIQEANVSMGLHHRYIVRVHEYREYDGVPCLLMERLYGESLKVSIDAHKRLAPHEAARIASQVAEALRYTHEKGILHRDLKPGNVMLVDDGCTAKLMDFGIAVTSDSERYTKTGIVIGTPEYMSPERLEGAEATAGSDLYALGLILYEMITGQYGAPPKMRMKNDHPSPSAVVDLPPLLDAIVSKLLARDARARYVSARRLLDDFARFIERPS